jgi:Polyketide cyclase / dehydrase and lipid transport
MQTTQSLTRSTTVAAAPSAVLDLVGDPRTLPRWAPAFARGVRPDEGDRWVVDSGAGEFVIRVLRRSDAAGTVDFVAPDEDRGLFTRVVPNGDGSELVLTLIISPQITPEALERQTAVLEAEVRAIRDLCEGPGRAAVNAR